MVIYKAKEVALIERQPLYFMINQMIIQPLLQQLQL